MLHVGEFHKTVLLFSRMISTEEINRNAGYNFYEGRHVAYIIYPLLLGNRKERRNFFLEFVLYGISDVLDTVFDLLVADRVGGFVFRFTFQPFKRNPWNACVPVFPISCPGKKRKCVILFRKNREILFQFRFFFQKRKHPPVSIFKSACCELIFRKDRSCPGNGRKGTVFGNPVGQRKFGEPVLGESHRTGKIVEIQNSISESGIVKTAGQKVCTVKERGIAFRIVGFQHFI